MRSPFFLIAFNQQLIFFLGLPAILLLGLLYSHKLKYLQIRYLGKSIQLLFSKEEETPGGISKKQAVAAVLAGNFGTGNISGMAVALGIGGPGAIVWMWITLFFGLIIQYANCLLGAKFKETRGGRLFGGPMYYLKNPLNRPKIASLFAICVIFGAYGVGGCIQVNSIALPLEDVGIPKLMTGVIMAFLLLAVIRSKTQGIVKTCSMIVPIMALCYVACLGYLLILYSENFLYALNLIFKSAFTMSAFAGGAAGFGLIKVISTGISRSILATDIGTGLASMLQSSANCKTPKENGILAMAAPLCVLVICTLTTLALIVTKAHLTPLESTKMVIYAFSQALGPYVGAIVVSSALIFFGYTTMLTWAACLENAVIFLWSEKRVNLFFYLYGVVVLCAGFIPTYLAWGLGDLAVTSMMLINLCAMTFLSKEVFAESRSFVAQTPLKSAYTVSESS